MSKKMMGGGAIFVAILMTLTQLSRTPVIYKKMPDDTLGVVGRYLSVVRSFNHGETF